ncbi:MAG: V-type ATP synthase subunit I [Clostridia bacterium]|nr:V-type ATP synthase subunit I [Clostridia bacterium]
MAILKMQRISIYALTRYSKDVLETLQRMGVVEIENISLEDSVFYKTDNSALSASFVRSASLMTQAADIVTEYVKEKKGLLSSFAGRTPLNVKEYEEFALKNPEALNLAYKLIGYKKKITESKAKIIAYESRIDSLIPWKNLDVSMDAGYTRSTKAIIGVLPEELTEDEICLKLAEVSPETELFDVEVISSDSNQTCVFVICYKGVYDELMSALRKIGLILPSSSTPGNPADEIKSLYSKIKKREETIAECEKAIASHSPDLELLRFFEDYYIMKADRYAQLDNISYSPHTFVMTGYIPQKDSQKLSEILFERYGAEVELEDAEGDDVPVLLKNNALTAPAEGVLLSYSAPSRFELDPTAVMAIFYYIFFGMMFSDAGYGLVMALACGIALLKFKNMEAGLKRSLKMFFFCGISTTFWGLMFGSFFGDAVSVIFSTFIGRAAPAIPGITTPIWFNPTVGSGPTTLLMFSFLFGIIHLFAGLILQAVNYIRQGNFIYAVYDDLSWILVVTGAVLALLSTDMLSGMMGGFKLDPVFLTVGGIMAGIGAVIILIFSGRESKNPLKRLLKGAYNLYGATSYLSDILSYSRLLALGLATGVVAGVFNQLGSMMGNSVVGIILFVVVFIIGHLLNIGINALGAYVHTNRLQFVEFFGKFYTGGGRDFKPYAVNTKHYNIKEDI